MELIVIRHARPERIEGAGGASAADPDLTEIGHLQAAALADWLITEQIDALYVSPMARARQTCAPIEAAMGIKATVEERVKEYDASSAEYVPIEEVKADKKRWKEWVARSQAEDRTHFADTVMEGMNEVIANHPGQRVAVVCHGGVINMVASRILGLRDEMFFNPNYSSVNRFMAASSGERSVLSLNDIGHLRARPDLVLY